MKPTTEQIEAWLKSDNSWSELIAVAYAAGAKAMQERCAKVCERIDADGWEVNMAEIIRALGDDDGKE